MPPSSQSFRSRLRSITGGKLSKSVFANSKRASESWRQPLRLATGSVMTTAPETDERAQATSTRDLRRDLRRQIALLSILARSLRRHDGGDRAPLRYFCLRHPAPGLDSAPTTLVRLMSVDSCTTLCSCIRRRWTSAQCQSEQKKQKCPRQVVTRRLLSTGLMAQPACPRWDPC